MNFLSFWIKAKTPTRGKPSELLGKLLMLEYRQIYTSPDLGNLHTKYSKVRSNPASSKY